MLPASLLLGCETQLAARDSYFTRNDRQVAAQGSQVQELVRYNRSRQAVRASCLLSLSRTGPADPSGLHIGNGREALAELCASSAAPPPHAHGGILNAYGRWLQDEIRELERPDDSADRAGG